MTKKTPSPHSMDIYYLEADEWKFAFDSLPRIGPRYTYSYFKGGDGEENLLIMTPIHRDDPFPRIEMQTTRGIKVDVVEVSIDLIRALAKGGTIPFIAYQLLSNGKIRILDNQTLNDEAPVKKARKMKKEKIPHRWPATVARR